MASFRPHEDQENRGIPEMRFKRPHNLLKGKQPFGSNSQPAATENVGAKPAPPLVLVVQFEAFKVYEDPKEKPRLRLQHGKHKESAKELNKTIQDLSDTSFETETKHAVEIIELDSSSDTSEQLDDEDSQDRYLEDIPVESLNVGHLDAIPEEAENSVNEKTEACISLHYIPENNVEIIELDSSSDTSEQLDSESTETTVASQRLTPAKFATAHIKASISSGHLVKIFPHYPRDGQTAFVEVSNLHDLLGNDDEYKDLLEFRGPLVKGVSHKKTIIEYCESKIRSAICSRDIADVDSYILMRELLILLLKQNGMVVGTDIAELLMKDRKQQPSRRGSVVSNSSSVAAEGATVSEASNLPVSETHSSSTSILKEDVVTNKFRDYLIYGSGEEALEWAMEHGLWGHALFLASKLDKRTYANVMTRFANGLTMNDPLQTLYQLLSGKVPASVTCVADEKWGDWRPHLAMILSNTTQRPELNRKAITTLGDTLFSRGSLYAAQFCYLMAHVGFSRYGADGGKLVLLGSNHNKPFLEFANNEAIQMTEVYEYACSLNDAAFIIPEFLPYKYLLATRLADQGLLEKALAYLEKITLAVLQNPSLAQQSLVSQVCQLADRLKYCDPVEEPFEEGDGEFDSSRPDHSWLKDLKAIERDYNMGLITHESVDNFAADTPESDPSQTVQAVYEQQTTQESWQQQYIDSQQYQQQQQWQTPQYTEQQPHLEYQQHVQSQPPNIFWNLGG